MPAADLAAKVELFAEEATEEFDLGSVRTALRAQGVDEGSVSDDRLATILTRSGLVFAAEAGRFAPRRAVFEGSRLLVLLREAEAAAALFVPGHRLLPFHSHRVASWECTIRVDGVEIPTRRTDLALEDIHACFALSGPGELAAALAAAAGESSPSARGRRGRASLTVFDLPPLLLDANPRAGDLLLLTVRDWLAGVFDLQLLSAETASPLFGEIDRWQAELEEGFLRAFDRMGATLAVPEVIAHALFFAGEWVRRNPQIGIDGFLERSARVGVASLGSGRCLWRAGEQPQLGHAPENEPRGDRDSLEAILDDLGYSVEPEVIEAYLRDERSGAGDAVGRAISRVFAGHLPVFVNREQADAFDRCIDEIWYRVRATSHSSREEAAAPLRRRALEIYDKWLLWLRGLDADRVEPGDLPTEGMMTLIQCTHFLEGALALLNGSEPLDPGKTAELAVSMDGLEEMLVNAMAAMSEKIGRRRGRRQGRSASVRRDVRGARRPSRAAEGAPARRAPRPPTAGSQRSAPDYVLKVSLQGVRPPVWRRFRVSSRVTLRRLHEVLQVVMGWSDDHAHGFAVGGSRYGVLSGGDGWQDAGWQDERKITLARVLPAAGASLVYEYDFGDGWRHKVVVEKVVPAGGGKHAVCLGGRRACPPEDCGGVPGYAGLLEALAHPDDREAAEILEWADDFDPEAFDVEAVNRILERM